MVQDRAIFTMADQLDVMYRLLNSAIFNDLEGVLTQILRACHYSMLNLSKIFTITEPSSTHYRHRCAAC